MNVVTHTENKITYVYMLAPITTNEEKIKFLLAIGDLNNKIVITLQQENIISPFTALEIIRMQESPELYRLAVRVEARTLSNYLASLKIRHRLTDGNTKISTRIPALTDTHVKKFTEKISQYYGFNLVEYDQDLLKRSITKFMHNSGINTVGQLFIEIQARKVFDNFFNEFAISVTRLFRSKKAFKFLVDEVFPYFESFPQIRVWSAGSSTGEESFSLAILLHEAGLLDKSIIYATDYNDNTLLRAKNNMISIDKVNDQSNDYIKSGGKHHLHEYFNIKGEVAILKDYLFNKIQFFNHNLLTDSSFNEFHLIVCQNVLIYFNHEQRIQVIDLFGESLNTSGFLLTGESEDISIHNGGLFNKVVSDINIFRKKIGE